MLRQDDIFTHFLERMLPLMVGTVHENNTPAPAYTLRHPGMYDSEKHSHDISTFIDDIIISVLVLRTYQEITAVL